MNEKIMVYKVHSDGNWCAFDNMDEAVEFVKTEIEAEVDELKPGEATRDYHIEVCKMKQEEYDKLPEFDGF